VSEDRGSLTRRQALRGLGLVAGALAASAGPAGAVRHAFHGAHQSGVTTPVQSHLAMAAFDVVGSRGDLEALLARWTRAAARFVEGEPLPGSAGPTYPPADTGEARDLPAAGLTLTFGLGPSLFREELGLSARRPRALIDLPSFPGDRLDPARGGGDLMVQACADDPVVAFHAVRNLTRLGEGVVVSRWLQLGAGRTSSSEPGQRTPRNLLGFKDGTANLDPRDPRSMARYVWVAPRSDQRWMDGGTYLVARRIRIHLEAWAALSLGAQEATIGRRRDSGAPLTGTRESDPPRLDVRGPYGALVIPEGAHIRAASPSRNAGARLLRRGFTFTDGLDPRTGELDAGLMFLCFQNDPARQFVTLQSTLATSDALSTYVTHTGSAIFACPPGAARGDAIATGLFD
jgi:deferrochelatase/peroxidase EfeB